ncbi:hypothetical protein [Prevotella veroralis]|uniref:Uncharacterized protein n=1 Tax=Prevotella veroralis F0319 TaxID=649761 RepID=C9MKC4_9BACT|nr:hypothetical protein [Prevotella veroralis]EEX20068.1 hypothetical protein HMPREF0973_00043 [Prevotella veroralis F0319]QUB42106.1 hypothetical protein J5A55_09505 [Prevotella veroralis]
MEESLPSHQGNALFASKRRPLQIEETPSSNQRRAALHINNVPPSHQQRATLHINDTPPVGTDALVCPHKGA